MGENSESNNGFKNYNKNCSPSWQFTTEDSRVTVQVNNNGYYLDQNWFIKSITKPSAQFTKVYLW